MKRVLIFGAGGGIGSEIISLWSHCDKIIPVHKNDINFLVEDDYKKLKDILDSQKPDIVVNACGIFGDNSIDFKSMFEVNVRSNWEILNYYNNNLPDKK